VQRDVPRQSIALACMVEPQVKCGENQDNADVHNKAQERVVLQEQDVHTDHDADKRKHVDHAGYAPSHAFEHIRPPPLGELLDTFRSPLRSTSRTCLARFRGASLGVEASHRPGAWGHPWRMRQSVHER